MVTIEWILILAVQATPTSASASAPESPPPRIVRTLEMDPETPLEIEGWWSDGKGLLEVQPDGRYRAWSTIDRFRRPTDVGRWHRENHAVFWLDSYRVPKAPRTRVPLWLRNGSLMATLDPEESAYSKMLVPPTVPTESLLGGWTCEGHRLTFSEDLRWRHRPEEVDPLVPVRRDALGGTWRMSLDGVLHMQPESLAEPPVTELVRDDGGRLVGLRSPYGTFVRVPPIAEIRAANPPRPADEEMEDPGPIPSTPNG